MQQQWRTYVLGQGNSSVAYTVLNCNSMGLCIIAVAAALVANKHRSVCSESDRRLQIESILAVQW
jgi:hypothetical protein